MTGNVVVVPESFVDGVHARNVMSSDEFPLRIHVFSTGQILEIEGFNNGMAVYSSPYKEGGIYGTISGAYDGKLGKDFLYID